MTQSISPIAGVTQLWHKLTRSETGQLTEQNINHIALILRFGIGSVFVIGGWWKLSRAIDPTRADALVSKYLAPNGYINGFFQEYLFTNDLLTPWAFMTALSTFELFAGLALLLGIFVRPLSIIFGLLMWSFVAALPVVTTPDLIPTDSTFLTPALIVQIRDVGLSGFCFALAIVGSGAYSLDARLLGRGRALGLVEWATLGLLVRISIAVVFLTGGFFFGLDHVKSWTGIPLLSIGIGITMLSGHGVRVAAVAALVVLLFYCVGKLDAAKPLWDNLNAIKREFAFCAAASLLLCFSGGQAFQVGYLIRHPKTALFGSEQQTHQS
ncbi:DoxX family membrane protein [Roseovarius sp. EL26]|uniref:DoxX family membrane protein n=1 Tax=Roseovarius sp. EL26 TaxID=2126672 RepID=UPI000EA1A081|nr:DoxX family membrane protein [Roseovarius sp. EL26]